MALDGDARPTQRELADRFGVTQPVIVRAIKRIAAANDNAEDTSVTSQAA